MQLMKRDLRILGLIREQGFITAEQARHEFSGVRMSEVYRRLGELRNTKLIRSENLFYYNKNIYLAERANFEIGRCDPFGEDLACLTRVRMNQLHHDLLTTDVRISLQRLFPVSLWTPESVLRRRASVTPSFLDRPPIGDGEMETEEFGRIMIEVECSNKAERRTRKIMGDWMSNRAVNFTLYVATEEEVYRKLSSVLKSMGDHPRCEYVGITRFNELRSATASIPIFTQDGSDEIKTQLNESKGIETYANESNSV